MASTTKVEKSHDYALATEENPEVLKNKQKRSLLKVLKGSKHYIATRLS